MKAIAVAIFLIASASASAQVTRNADEYGGKNHQPTPGEIAQRERNAGTTPSPAEKGRDTRSIEQLDKQLMRTERVDPPRSAGQSMTPPASR